MNIDLLYNDFPFRELLKNFTKASKANEEMAKQYLEMVVKRVLELTEAVRFPPAPQQVPQQPKFFGSAMPMIDVAPSTPVEQAKLAEEATTVQQAAAQQLTLIADGILNEYKKGKRKILIDACNHEQLALALSMRNLPAPSYSFAKGGKFVAIFPGSDLDGILG